MKNVRLFIAVIFHNEEELIELLPAIEKRAGKYDYFTQNIPLEPSFYGPGFNVRLFSFSGLYDVSKLTAFIKKNKKHFEIGETGEIHMGYANKFHVVTVQESEGMYRVETSEQNFSQLQLIFKTKTCEAVVGNLSFFNELRVKQYFNDLHRVIIK
ncbi:MAG: DUF4416 family protein [Leptospirales bacterium]